MTPTEIRRPELGDLYKHKQYGTVGKVVGVDGHHVKLLFGENPRQRQVRLYLEQLNEHYEFVRSCPPEDS